MAACVYGDRFEYTATGVLGDKRDTMLQNELLLRSELGKPVTRGYLSYPGHSARYGRPNISTDGGAPEALRGWTSGMYFNKRGGAAAGGKADRDFMALNRAAVVAGLTTAPEHHKFRATHDIRKSLQTEDEKTSNRTRRLPASMTFGVATRPSTPIHDLLEHKYQDRWLSERRSQNSSRCREGDTQNVPGKVYETRASLLRMYQVPVEEAPLWKMKRFTDTALPSLNTFRGEGARSNAFKHHQSDCISRKGVFGHGNYEQAKN